MNDTNEIINKLFRSRWTGHLNSAPIDEMRKQLQKNLQNQIDGFWTGHTAYWIMVDGGFLIDSKMVRIEGTGMSEGKKLTELGKMFMRSMNE